MVTSVCVVGAGIVGLSTAINIQKLIKHVTVTVLADSFGEDTVKVDKTSLFLPTPACVRGVDPVTVQEWLIDGYNHHSSMANSPQGQESGQEFMAGVYMFTDESEREKLPLPKLVSNFRFLTEDEKTTLNYAWDYVCSFETVVVDEIKYVRWLMKEFRQNGGLIKFGTINALQELYGMFDVVVNCTGRRNLEVVVDPFFYKHRSRTVQLQKHFDKKKFIIEDSFCFLPHTDSDVIDISWTTPPRETDIIIEDTNARLLVHLAKSRVPQLEGSEYVTEWQEEMSWRPPPLVEKEMIRCGQGPMLPVVHNVGHGCDAITLAWGTAAYAAHLVQDCQRLVKPFIPVWRPFDPNSC